MSKQRLVFWDHRGKRRWTKIIGIILSSTEAAGFDLSSGDFPFRNHSATYNQNRTLRRASPSEKAQAQQRKLVGKQHT